MQKWDWTRDATRAEEDEMTAAGWDTEDVVLGAPEERYIQPALKRDAAAHERTLVEARDISSRVDAFNAGAHHVRPRALELSAAQGEPPRRLP